MRNQSNFDVVLLSARECAPAAFLHHGLCVSDEAFVLFFFFFGVLILGQRQWLFEL